MTRRIALMCDSVRGEAAELAAGVLVCIDRNDRPLDGFSCLFSAGYPYAPTVAIDAQANEVAPADGELGVEMRALRYVADAGVAPLRIFAEHFQVASGRCQQAEDKAHERRFAGAVGAEDGCDRAGGNVGS